MDLLSSLRGLVRAPRGVNLDDALHEALVRLLEHSASVSDDPKQAEIAIREAVIQVSKRHVDARVQHKKRFPPIRHWHIEGKSIPSGDEFAQPDRVEDPLYRIPDTRPNPVEELIEAEQQVTLTAVAARVEADPGPQGVLYRLIYVDRRPLAEVAGLLGVSLSAVKKRAERLRKLLREELRTVSKG